MSKIGEHIERLYIYRESFDGIALGIEEEGRSFIACAGDKVDGMDELVF